MCGIIRREFPEWDRVRNDPPATSRNCVQMVGKQEVGRDYSPEVSLRLAMFIQSSDRINLGNVNS